MTPSPQIPAPAAPIAAPNAAPPAARRAGPKAAPATAAAATTGTAAADTATATAAGAKAAPAARLTDPAFSALIRRQHGVVTAAQAAAYGLAHETVRRRVARGIWQRLLTGLYVLQCGPPSTLQWSIAALLYAGERSMLTGPAALAAHRLPIPRVPATSPLFAHIAPPNLTPPNLTLPNLTPPNLTPPTLSVPFPPAVPIPVSAPIPVPDELPLPPILARFPRFAPVPIPAASIDGVPYIPRLDVLVPHRMRRQNVAGIRIVRTTHLPVPVEAGPLRFAPLARAVIDTCLAVFEAGNTDCAELLIAATLADGRVSLAELDDVLALAPRRGAAALRGHLTRLRTAARGAASHRLYDALTATAQDPSPPILDVAVYDGNRRVAQATALWPTRAVAAAVDAPEHEVKTLSNLGFAVVQIAPQRVADDLPGVLRQVRTTLRERPEATLPTGVSLLPRATPFAAPLPTPPAHPHPPTARMRTQRVLTASSPARTGRGSLLPRGGTGQT